MLAGHEPLPAVVLDRGWNLVQANQGAQRLFGALFDPAPVPEPATCCGSCSSPDRFDWAWPTGKRSHRRCSSARREAVGGVLDLDTAELVRELQAPPDVAALLAAPRAIAPILPVIDVHFRLGDACLRFFSVVSTIGTPIDVTAQELRVEMFFPADDETQARWLATA